MNRISPALLGFLRGLGLIIITAVLSYLGAAENLAFLNPITASLIATIALSIEHSIEAKSGRALFGAVRS